MHATRAPPYCSSSTTWKSSRATRRGSSPSTAAASSPTARQPTCCATSMSAATSPARRPEMLRVDALHVTIASVQALRGFSLEVPAGRMVGLIGRNGAGKTSLMRAIMGHLPLRSGGITLDGRDLGAMPRHLRAGLGIGYMPEDRGLVPELTVEENILVPVWASKTLKEAERLAFVYSVLPEMKDMRERRALLLSGGQQK